MIPNEERNEYICSCGDSMYRNYRQTLTSGIMSSIGSSVGYSVGSLVKGAFVGLSVGSSVTGEYVGSGNFASSISVGSGVGAEEPQLSITGVDVGFFVGFFEGLGVG